jgi:hypothetical protein
MDGAEIQMPVERVRLEGLIALAQKRAARAEERRDGANREFGDAFDALEVANANLAAWKAANPDPQLSLAGIFTEGENQ